MRNYISVNLKHYKKKEIDRMARHNSRVEKINYLLKKEHIEYENVNIFYENNLINKGDNLLTKVGEYSSDQKNLFSKEDLDLNLRRQYNLLINKKEAIQRQNKSYTKTNESTLIEMVVALSEEQAKAYLKDGKDLAIGFDRLALNLQKKHGFTPLQTSIHLDEGYIDENGIVKNNIHAHLSFVNFSFDKEKVCLRNLKKQDYKDLQDLAAESFQDVGFNFIRGTDKEISSAEHLEKNDHVLKKQKIKILENETKIENLNNILKSLIPKVNEEKKDLKALLNTFDKNSDEYKLVYNLVGNTMTLEKEVRKYAKIEDFNNENLKELKTLLRNHLDKTNNFYKLNFDKVKPLVDSLFNFLNKINKVDLEFTNTKEKDKKITELEEQLKVKEEQNNMLLDKLNEERNKNKVSERNEGQIIAQNQKALQIMDKQQKALIRETRRNQRLRNQRNKYFQKLMRDNNLTKAMQTRKFLRDNKNRDLNKNKIKKTIEENYDLDR